MKYVHFFFSVLLIYSLSFSNLINGYYRITGVVISIDGNRPKGRNTADLYIFSDGSYIRIAGIHSGINISKEFSIEKVISDTLVVTDRENFHNRFRFEIDGNEISGEFSYEDKDGNSHLCHVKARTNKLDRREIQKLRVLHPFLN
ncbi:MAG: hypothetical protein ACOCW1_00215 [Chitinispirillaceae bacterium]